MTPALLVRNVTAAFLVLVPAIIGYQMLTGRIWLAGLVYERDTKGRMVYSPARLQLLLITVAGAAQYLFQFIQKPAAFPHIDGLTLTGLGSSQLLYLASKAWAGYQARKH